MLLSAIRASALLHLRQRERTSDGQIIANQDDYCLACRLLAQPLAQSLAGSLPPHLQKFLDKLHEETCTGETFTAAEAAKKVGKAKSTVSDYLKTLENRGLVEVDTEGRGPKPTKYKLATDNPAVTVRALPKPEDVFSSTAQGEQVTAT